jgi:hypothetical protein
VIFGNLQSRIGWHFVLESILIFAVVAEEDILIDVQHSILDVLFSEGREQLSIQIVSNSSTVEHFADHVLQDSCVNLLNLALLGSCAHQVIQVFFNKAERSLEIGVVVLVGHTPAQRTEFSSFYDNGVQVANSEDKVLPVGVIDFFQELLVYHSRKGFVETGFKTLRRLIGDLDHFL